MFKYLKTIGAHSGAAEIERMPVEASAIIPKNCLCEMNMGYLSNTYNEHKTKFVTLEDKSENDGKNYIDCIRALPGMIFECDFIGSIENVGIGSLINAGNEPDNYYDHCEDGSGDIEIVDISTYAKTNRIKVTFHC